MKTKCLRCGHTWYARTDEYAPRACPKCKNLYYWVEKGTLRRGRPPKARPESEPVQPEAKP